MSKQPSFFRWRKPEQRPDAPEGQITAKMLAKALWETKTMRPSDQPEKFDDLDQQLQRWHCSSAQAVLDVIPKADAPEGPIVEPPETACHDFLEWYNNRKFAARDGKQDELPRDWTLVDTIIYWWENISDRTPIDRRDAQQETHG